MRRRRKHYPCCSGNWTCSSVATLRLLDSPAQENANLSSDCEAVISCLYKTAWCDVAPTPLWKLFLITCSGAVVIIIISIICRFFGILFGCFHHVSFLVLFLDPFHLLGFLGWSVESWSVGQNGFDCGCDGINLYCGCATNIWCVRPDRLLPLPALDCLLFIGSFFFGLHLLHFRGSTPRLPLGLLQSLKINK